MNINSGVQNIGTGNLTIGDGNRIGSTVDHDETIAGQADIGVITVLSSEASAAIGVLDDAYTARADGVRVHRGHIGNAAVVVTRAERQGNRSTGPSFQLLRTHYRPGVIVVMGIGGGIHSDVQPGDVVIGQEIVYYDLRKETATGVLRRSEGHQVPAWVRREVNDFFTDHGEPYTLPGTAAKALAGPLGSGEAVVAHSDSQIRHHLAVVNDKILALDMETGGLALAFHTQTGEPKTSGWLTIRGISDNADENKDDTHHQIAADNAAAVFRELVPYLVDGLNHQR
ncbi:hypothetical protein HUT06_21565 [Actinomadura sp. NAK00032]|uniref:5'-methylthioadenosine/S-adenosylhomocysteine nucleosidase family protein n=1 Tax=Actinomadura sp. NAK00032 TaxID=2742128 RepID=UPI001590B44F|nr:hypothetical protein [Actinomadura sp. NAK00032]QKW36300.1 hypothetical protein HUT06_21565 [Actinomadura sp. NAK00032]